MLRNVLIVKLAKLYTVNSMYFLSALYMLWYVPIVKMSLVIFFQKKKKNDPYFGMGEKNTKVMPQKPCYLYFLLGKGGNPYISKLYIKNLVKCAFCPAPQHANHSDSDTVWTTHAKINKKLTKFSSLCRNFHTFPVTEGYAICISISSSQPLQESSPTDQNSSDPERHKFWKHHVSSLPEARETPKILPKKTQILATPKFFATWSQEITKINRKRHEFHTKLHSLTPAKMPRKVFSFPEFCTSL